MAEEAVADLAKLKACAASLKSRLKALESAAAAKEDADDAGEEGAARSEWAAREYWLDDDRQAAIQMGGGCVSHEYRDMYCWANLGLFLDYWRQTREDPYIDMASINHLGGLRWTLVHEKKTGREEHTVSTQPLGELAWALWGGFYLWFVEWALPRLFGKGDFGPNDPQILKDLKNMIAEALSQKKMAERRCWRIEKVDGQFEFKNRYVMCGREVLEAPSGVISGSGFYYVEINKASKTATLHKGAMPANTENLTNVPIAQLTMETDELGIRTAVATKDYRDMPTVTLFE